MDLLRIQAKCKKCNYNWVTKSEMYFVSCPSCGSKVQLKKVSKCHE